MNIAQAAKRVDDLQGYVEGLDIATTVISRDNNQEYVIAFFIPNGHGGTFERRVTVKKDALLECLANAVDSHQEEASILKPVIDMANAALKGVLSDGVSK